jgi:hypothetical protein
MPYIGNTPALDYISYAVQNFTVTAGTTSYALDYSVSNENDIRLVINNVIQRPGASFAYSATGTTLTLTSATLATDTMYAVFIGRAVQTVTPPANSITNTMLNSSAITGQTAETSVAGGDLVLIYDDSATALRKMTRTNFVAGIGGVNTPLVQANLTGGDQSISATTYTKIAFNTVTIDTGSIYNNGTYTATIATTGKYFVSTYCRISALNSGASEFGVLQIANSARSTTYATTVQSAFTGTGYGFHSLACSALISLSASDTLSVFVYGTEAVSVSEDNAGFTIFKVIE